MSTAQKLQAFLHPESFVDRAVVRGCIAVSAGFAGFLDYVMTHWCDRGIPWIEENALYIGPPLCFMSVICIERYRWALLAVIVLLAIWPLYLEIIHW